MTLGWDRTQSNPRYAALHARCHRIFEEDPNFRRACLDSSRWVLDGRSNGKQLDESALLRAAKYFLAEVPFFVDSPGILQETASVFCYHKSIPFLDDLYNDRLPITRNGAQGFVVITDRH